MGSGGQGGLGQGPLAALKAGREVAVLPLLPPSTGFLFTASRVAGSDGGGAPCSSSFTSRPCSPARDSGARPWAAGGGRGGGGPRPKHRPGAEENMKQVSK